MLARKVRSKERRTSRWPPRRRTRLWQVSSLPRERSRAQPFGLGTTRSLRSKRVSLQASPTRWANSRKPQGSRTAAVAGGRG